MILDIGLAARVVEGVRAHTSQRTGCEPWQTPGIVQALKATEGTPGAALAAALLAAEDASCRTPNPTTFAAHWPRNAETAPPAPRHAMHCPEHPDEVMPCGQCKNGDYVPPPPGWRDEPDKAIAEAAKKRPYKSSKPYTPKGTK